MHGKALETVKRLTSKGSPRALEEGVYQIPPNMALRVDILVDTRVSVPS